jgi:peptidoglycan-associated lipoprotein
MLKNITAAFFAVILLSGCSSSVNNKYSGNEEMSAVAEFERTVGDRVFFAYNSHTLSEEAKHTLKRQSAWLADHKTFNMTIEGHCDERGTKEYNIALGEKRAMSIKHFLTSHGIDSHRIETISYGKERPAVIGDNEAAWGKNRRGVTSIR